MNQNIKITEIVDKIYCIEELSYLEHCNCYLIIGTKKCLLIDLGIGLINFQNILKPFIKDKELITVITHFHFDHIGGVPQFDEVLGNKVNLNKKDIGMKYFNKKDFLQKDNLPKINSFIIKEKIKQIKEKTIIDLGDFKFKIIFTPGHDKTSISLFEENKKIIFTGDLIYDGELYFDFKDSNKQEQIKSLKKILKLKPKIICGGHNRPIKKNTFDFITSKILLIKNSTK